MSTRDKEKNRIDGIDVFFLGLMYSDATLEEARTCSKVGIQMAPHIFQQNLLKGFADRQDVSLKVIHVPPIGSFPIHYKKALMHTNRWKDNYEQIGYLNVPVVKHKIQEGRIISLIEKALDSSKEQHILIYTMYPPFVRAAHVLKNKHPELSVSLLQTDPVLGKDGIYTKNSNNNIRKGRELIELMKNFDSFVVLTKYLAEAMETGDRPYTIVDCIINDSVNDSVVSDRPANRNRFLYTGSTRSTNGIITLVDAFRYLPDAERWICGGGDSDEYIREQEKELSNIRFFGSVDHSRISDIQSQCDYMVNPRTPTGGFTKYSFPSKTAEYMMTGKPTVMYKLEGLSEEYDELLNYVYAEDPRGLAEELKSIINMDQEFLMAKALRAKMYVQREKSPKAQADRIITMWNRAK